MTRRQLIAAFSAWPALAQQPVQGPAGATRFSDYPFSLGVASGDPDPSGFVLWTRLAPKPLEGGGMPREDVRVEWQVATDEGFWNVAASGEAAAKHELGHSVHVEVSGLEPERWYHYRFRAGSEISQAGRAKTAPPAGKTADRVRFAFASCQHYETGYYTAYEHMVREAPDIVFHLGDYIYEGSGRDGRVRKHTGQEIMELDDYRNRLALYKTDPDLQAAHAAAPWVVTWDDHEVDNNYADRISEEPDVAIDDFLTRRAHAYQAYYENQPLRLGAKPRGHDMQLYRRVPYGGLLDFTVLDTRQYRTDQPCGDRNGPGCGDDRSPDGNLLGDEQEKWFFQALERSPAKWNVVAQQIMVAPIDRDPGPAAAYSMDQWPGYRASQERFLKFLGEKKPSNPVVLTGDIHSNWANDLYEDYSADNPKIVGTELVGTSISSGGDGRRSLSEAKALRDANPCLHFHNRERGYVSCLVTPERMEAKYQMVEYVSRRGAPLNTRAAFTIEDGRPGLQRS